VQKGGVDQLLLDWQVIVPEPLFISYPVIHVYVTASSYLNPVLVVADEFVFSITGNSLQLISTRDQYNHLWSKLIIMLTVAGWWCWPSSVGLTRYSIRTVGDLIPSYTCVCYCISISCSCTCGSWRVCVWHHSECTTANFYNVIKIKLKDKRNQHNSLKNITGKLQVDIAPGKKNYFKNKYDQKKTRVEIKFASRKT